MISRASRLHIISQVSGQASPDLCPCQSVMSSSCQANDRRRPPQSVLRSVLYQTRQTER